MSADGLIKLADFGLAIDIHEERPVSRLGTLDYMVSCREGGGTLDYMAGRRSFTLQESKRILVGGPPHPLIPRTLSNLRSPIRPPRSSCAPPGQSWTKKRGNGCNTQAR